MRGLIVLVLIGAVVGGIVLTGGSSSGSVTTPPVVNAPTGNTPAPTGTAPTVVAPVKIVLEAEEPTTTDPLDLKTGTKFLEIREQREGKLVRFVDIPEKLIEKCGLEKEKDKVAGLPGKSTYEFEAPRDDTYYVFLRAKWYDSCGNSVWVRVDDSSYLNLEDENGKEGERTFKWAWHALMQEGRPKGFKLSKGKHTLYFAVREDGPWLDQWLISTEASMPGSAAPLSK